MSTPSEKMDRIDDAAAGWLVEREEGWPPARAHEFDCWCRADPRHAAAVARLEQACAFLEAMPQVRDELLPVVEFPATRASERSSTVSLRVAWSKIVVGLAAVLALAALALWQWPHSQLPAIVHSTSTGGYERVVLADGSVVELNANSEVRVEFAPGERRVALVAGEAHFTVAHDTARPFVVSAGHVSVRAVGTAFNVRRATAAVEVLVTEGKVQLDQKVERVDPNALHAASDDPARWGQRAPPQGTLLLANERLLIPDSATPPSSALQPGSTAPIVEKISPELIRAALAWQERKLVFADTPLCEVVAQFNRRNRLQLILADATLAERPVGGTFAADNAEGFVRLLENSGSIAVERRGEFEIVLRPSR
jgi:transmembrane sensor